jgi:hypothetical protein
MKTENSGSIVKRTTNKTQPKASGADGAMSMGANGSQPATESNRSTWYYKVDRFTFLPIKQKADWTNEQDVREYEARFGKSDDRLRDTRIRLNQNVAELHRVLASGINYFLQKRGVLSLRAPRSLDLRQKVELFTDLLSNFDDSDYVLRFTTTLARVLWLESEQSRILAQRGNQPWLYPMYHLTDCIATTTIDLEESLCCEHNDFRDSMAHEAGEDDGIAEEPD